jgi:iron(III) transport system substrate-binding protein
MRKNRSRAGLIAAALGAAAFFALFQASRTPDDALVVYCAHDSVYSDEILRKFEQQTGIRVVSHFDTEATKSLGLVNRLLAEKAHPQCDVFWNNEILGTMRLAREGVLEPYRGPGHDRIPEQYKNPDGLWTGFAARFRVWIVNTDRMPADEAAVAAKLESDDLSSMAIARPLYGTTRVHYSLLWQEWGEETLKKWHTATRERGLLEVNGNSTVKNLVAEGKIDCGWTDTDDFFLAVDDKKPVEAIPIRTKAGRTICIPNTVAIVNGTSRREAAERLVDFLLSAETELALARSSSRQVPLGPVDPKELPEEVRRISKWAADGYDLNRLAETHDSCLAWLLREYSE